MKNIYNTFDGKITKTALKKISLIDMIWAMAKYCTL